jgi:hypothetical protein
VAELGKFCYMWVLGHIFGCLTTFTSCVADACIARSWRQRWNKNEAISLIADYLRRGEWALLPS